MIRKRREHRQGRQLQGEFKGERDDFYSKQRVLFKDR
jgi:hypothetical protein